MVDWYGLAFDDRQLRALGEDLTAFVGPTYTTFRGQLARLAVTDAVEAAVQRLTGGRAFKFRGDPAADKPAEVVWGVLQRMLSVWRRRVSSARGPVRPVGRTLRDFFMAVEAGNRAAAEEHLDRLATQHPFDAVNLLFLRVQLWAALGCREELLRLSALPELLRLRLPVAVTQALIEAVYASELRRFEEQGDPAGAVQHFRTEVAPRYGTLFTARAGLRSAAVLKSIML